MLSLQNLQSQINSVMRTKTASAASAARSFVDAYVSYAAGAQAGVALPLFTGTEGSKMSSVLIPVFSNVNGNPASVASAWTQAIIGFWTLPPVTFSSISDAGVPIPGPTVSALTGCLTSLLSAPHTEVEASVLFASCLDAATRGFLVTLVPSMAVLPLS